MESRKHRDTGTSHKGYNEKNPTQPEGAFPPDGRNMPSPPGRRSVNKPEAPVARKKKKRHLRDGNG